jgi:hypothetical protein
MGENVPIPSDADGGTGPSPYAGNRFEIIFSQCRIIRAAVPTVPGPGSLAQWPASPTVTPVRQ